MKEVILAIARMNKNFRGMMNDFNKSRRLARKAMKIAKQIEALGRLK